MVLESIAYVFLDGPEIEFSPHFSLVLINCYELANPDYRGKVKAGPKVPNRQPDL
jgi:hypothetical protein